jgi:hypothetical protein
MQGNACGRWTLGVMFPLGYRVSNYEGYKQGSAWLRMQKLLMQMVYNAKREPAKRSILQARHEMQSQLNAKNIIFYVL